MACDKFTFSDVVEMLWSRIYKGAEGSRPIDVVFDVSMLNGT